MSAVPVSQRSYFCVTAQDMMQTWPLARLEPLSKPLSDLEPHPISREVQKETSGYSSTDTRSRESTDSNRSGFPQTQEITDRQQGS